MPRQTRRTYTSEFKKQMVGLYENGKSRAAIAVEYDLIALRKELQRLKMKNDMLKQATLIMGRK